MKFAVVLAGGTGSRLWPLSTEERPKPFLEWGGEGTLFHQTVGRILPLIEPRHIFTVTHVNYQEMAAVELQTFNSALAENVLAEPYRRNTLPAIAWATEMIIQKDPEALIAVFPSDHFISKTSHFTEALDQAYGVAAQGYLVTFGVNPDSPSSEYGYIQAGQKLPDAPAQIVDTFIEKPSPSHAKEIYQQNQIYWNSGIFVYKAMVFQKELRHFQPQLAAHIQDYIELLQQGQVDQANSHYKSLPSLSIDIGLMEKTRRAAVIEARFEWSDLGNLENFYGRRYK